MMSFLLIELQLLKALIFLISCLDNNVRLTSTTSSIHSVKETQSGCGGKDKTDIVKET